MKQGPVLVFPSEEPFFGKKELRRAFPVFQVYRVKMMAIHIIGA